MATPIANIDNSFLYNALTASPIGIAVGTLEGWPLFANPALCRMLGFSEEEMLHKHCMDFSPAEDAAKDRALFLQLRSGTINHYQMDKRYFRRDGSLVWGRLTVSLIKAVGPPLVLAMVEDISERKTADETLKQSEERYRLAAQAAKMFAFEWNASSDLMRRSEESAPLLESDEPRNTTGQAIASRIHPDDLGTVSAAAAALTPENPVLRVSYRSVRPSGEVIWAESHGLAHFDDSGKLLRIIGMVADITERRRAQQALADATRRLVHAQEEERARIARELHDDINQRLSMLAIDIDQLKESVPADSREIQTHLNGLHHDLTEISDSVRSLSYQLHPPHLEALGIVSAMRSFCRGFSERQSFEIDFEAQELTHPVLPEVALCLFRILQEALHNAAKHSQVRNFKIKISESARELYLAISDNGTGFDVQSALDKRGLGLISMKERARLANGTLEIESRPHRGTTIHVHIPFA